MTKWTLVIPLEAAGGRADRVLARLLPALPWPQLREAFARRDVKRNGQRIGPEATLAAGDALVLYTAGGDTPLEIVHEDDEYVVINKQQGMPTQGPGSAEEAFTRQRGEPVWACHRLDVQTGGLLLLAKQAQALRRAEEAFAAHTLEKTYHAIVRGVPEPSAATLRAYLRKDAEAARVSVYDTAVAGTLPIETRYRVLAAGDDLALLEIGLITGRTHQIRAHLAHIGHPVLGDDKYGDRAANKAHGARRQRLWATRLTLWDGRSFTVEAPFPEREEMRQV